MGGFKVLVLLVSVILSTNVLGQVYKLCTKQKDIDECVQINRNENFKCAQHMHNVDCMLGIENGTADFGTITPEEGLVGANFLNNVVVLGEFRLETEQNENYEFGTVILIRKSASNGFKDLRNKKYCHPGFKFDYGDYMLKEFESYVLKENNAEGCSNKVESGTLLEKEIKAISEFFGPSCRPGPWVGFDQYDLFYNKYSKLCELCPNKNCKDAPSSYMDSLQCLVNGGDVALTTLHNVNEFFNRSENANKIQEYGYLCRNGDVVGLESPCIWNKQPWNMIVANKNSAATLRQTLQELLSNYIIGGNPSVSDVDEGFLKSFKQVLFPEKLPAKIKLYETPLSLLDYLKEYRTVPTPTEKCNENVRWCTVSAAEQKKCEWLSQAAANIALQPTIKCIQSRDKFACLEDIKTDLADIVAADAHFGYISRKKSLAPLAYPDTDASNRIKPVIVIKSNDASIKKLEDLKTKKACFPEYGGIEWLSFINLTRDRGILPKSSCDYGKLITDFVGDSCMPGAHDREHEGTTEIDKDKLCRLCEMHPYKSKTATNCNSNSENRFYGNAGALNCLKEVGDFAVVTAGDYPDSNDLKVLCRNGSVASYGGLNVDENCVLTVIVDSEVLSKKTSSKNPNLQVILLHLESRFGFYINKPFEVFNVFNNTLDLLFKDSTQGLTRLDSDKKHIKNFVNLLSDHEKCVEVKDNNNTAAHLQITIQLVLTSLTILTIMQ